MDILDKMAILIGEATALERFEQFTNKYSGAKLTQHVNLRTKRMKNLKKLTDWYDMLDSEGYSAEAEFALQKIKTMTNA
jgi:hypothetical protein